VPILKRGAPLKTPAGPLDLAGIVDDGPLNAPRILIFLLITLGLFTDGYDITVISFIAPAVTADWGLSRDAMAAVFATGQAGAIIGTFAGGALADWRGRRPALLACLLLSGVAMLGSASAADAVQLAAWRFAAGLGVGAIVPICMVLGAEYAPRRIRATTQSCLFFGFGVGGTASAGSIAAALLPTYGWRWVLGAGGVLTLLVVLVLAVSLPESLKYLFARKPSSPQFWRNLRRIAPALRTIPEMSVVWTGEAEPESESRSALRLLFADGRHWLTATLWASMFVGQLTVFGFTMWLPTLLTGAGLGAGAIALVVVLFATGASLGSLGIARFVDRYGVMALTALPVLGVPAVLALRVVPLGDPIGIALITTVGACAGGVLNGLIIAAGQIYPTAGRANGVSAAVFVSRFGSVAGPLLLGAFIGGRVENVYTVCALVLLSTAAGTALLGVLHRAPAAVGRPAPARRAPGASQA